MINLATSLVPSLLGLGAKVGTAIPGLRKPARVNTAKAVAQTAGQQFGKAVGAAQTGHGATRGLALREGLRRGAAAVGQQSNAIAQAAAQDVMINQQNLDNRNARLASFGGDLAKGIGDMAAMAIGPEGGNAPTDQKTLTPAEAEHAATPGTGVAESPLMEDNTYDLDDIEQQVVDQETVAQEQVAAAKEGIVSGLPDVPEEPRGTEGIVSELYGSAPSVMPELEAEMERKFHTKALILDEAERMGLSLENILPRVNRRLQLAPGQSLYNRSGGYVPAGSEDDDA